MSPNKSSLADLRTHGVPQLPARSLSGSVRAFLQQPRTGTVVATFRRSCYLDFNGQIVALVASELLNGPLNVVVEALPEYSFQRLPVNTPAMSTPAGIALGAALFISFAIAETWPAAITSWTGHTEGRLRTNLALARTVLLREAARDSFAHARLRDPMESGEFDETLRVKAHRALRAFAAAFRHRELITLAESARQLSGLGPGLTPSGDDVLVGTLLALAVALPADVEPIRAALMRAVAGRSTRISGAYLEAAARGEASEAWLHLLAILPNGDPVMVTEAVRAVMAVGETSGADTLAGFLLALEATGVGSASR